MSGLPSSHIAAAATCPELAALKQLSRAELNDRANAVYNTPEKRALVDQDIWSWFADSAPPRFEEFIAEMIYFRQGRFLAEERDRVKDLTTAQLHYEVLVRGLFTQEELATATELKLVVEIRADNDQIARERQQDKSANNSAGNEDEPDHDSPMEEDDGEVKEQPNDSPMDEGEDEEDDGDDADDEEASDGSEESDESDEEPRRLNWKESGGLIRHWEPKLQRFVTYRY